MRGYIVALAAAGVALFLSFDARALDAPHDFADAGKTVEMQCDNCHTFHGATYPTLLGQLCQSCHVSGGEAPEVKTHSSRFIDNGYGNWEVDCWKCHDPHKQWQERDFGATRGVFLRRYLNAPIKEIDPNCTDPYCAPYLDGTTGTGTFRTESGTDIQFDADTGPDLVDDFVDGDTESIDDICQTCHEETSNYSSPLLPDNSPSNFHNPSGGDTVPGGNCTTCHNHADGFAPSGCTGCHANLQPAGASPPTGEYRRQVVGSGGDFSRKAHHVTDGSTTEVIADADCEICHAQDNHQSNTDPSVRLYNADDNATIYTYDGANPGASLKPFCLSCHDADGSTVDGAQPFSDGRTPPDIASAWNATGAQHSSLPNGCISCHGGPDSTDAALPDNEHNVHGSCGDFMLSSRVEGAAVVPNVAIVRIDETGRDFVHVINVDSTQIAQYTATRTDTPDIVRTALINEINAGAHGQPVSAEIFASIDDQVLLAVIPDDICTAFATIDGTGSTAGGTTAIGNIPTSSYLCIECHDADGPSTHNIVAQFDSTTGGALSGFILSQEFGTLLSRTHDVPTAINCNNCHDPHGPNGLGFELLPDTDPRYKWRTLRADPDPDNTGGRDVVPGDSNGDGIPDSTADGRLWTNAPTPSTWLTEWCLACHDGSMPADINLNGTLVNIEDSWLNPASANPNTHGQNPFGSGNIVCGSGYADCIPPNDGPFDLGQPFGGNVILNCIACHNAGHNAESGLYQTRRYPLAADGTEITILDDGTLAVQPYIGPKDGTVWCRACHDTNMNNDCQGCHQHADTRF